MDDLVGKIEASNLFYNNKLAHAIGSNKTINEGANSGRSSLLASQYEQTDSDKVSFVDYSEKVCVSVIDIVRSTSLVSTIGSSKDIRKFYEIYLNKIAIILKKYGASIVKTVGDGIISYFPKTTDIANI